MLQDGSDAETGDYEYDIFLSYKRHAEPRRWLVEHFQPLLEYYVELELGRKPRLFRDDQDIEGGMTWPAALGRALGNSRVLVSLWTRTYFHSEWCSHELSTMLAREQDERVRTAECPSGLVIPIVLHDCEQLPAELDPLQRVVLRDCFNPRMRHDSALAEALAANIARQVAPPVARAILAAPLWRRSWPSATASAFLAALKRPDQPRQARVPRFAP